MPGSINDTHAALAQLTDQLVIGFRYLRLFGLAEYPGWDHEVGLRLDRLSLHLDRGPGGRFRPVLPRPDQRDSLGGARGEFTCLVGLGYAVAVGCAQAFGRQPRLRPCTRFERLCITALVGGSLVFFRRGRPRRGARLQRLGKTALLGRSLVFFPLRRLGHGTRLQRLGKTAVLGGTLGFLPLRRLRRGIWPQRLGDTTLVGRPLAFFV